MNPFDEELKPGDYLTFTHEVALHLADLNIAHHLEYGDELVVVADDPERKFPILVSNPKDLTWQARIFAVIAWNARDFWLKQQELAIDHEGVSSPLPLAYWSKHYASLTPEERRQLWQDESGTGVDYETLWKLLTHSGEDKPT